MDALDIVMTIGLPLAVSGTVSSVAFQARSKLTTKELGFVINVCARVVSVIRYTSITVPAGRASAT
jgi:hypothetical protein